MNVCDPFTIADYNRVIDSDRRKFHTEGIPRKIDRLKEEFGVESEWDSHVLTLNRARNCLVHRLGIVSTKDVDENGALVLKWKSTKLSAVSPDGQTVKLIEGPELIEAGWTLQLTITTETKLFKVGDQLRLSYTELVNALFSIMNYVVALPQALDQYAVRCGVLNSGEHESK